MKKQKWSREDLARQLKRVEQEGWLEHFLTVSEQENIDPEILLAIGSRETGLRDIKGDFRGGKYHGFGIMQIDIGTDPKWCRRWKPGMILESIQKGAKILRQKSEYLMSRGVIDPRAFVSAYNTGEGNVLRSIRTGNDPDSTTTGKDYGADVHARALVFHELLSTREEPRPMEEPQIEPSPMAGKNGDSTPILANGFVAPTQTPIQVATSSAKSLWETIAAVGLSTIGAAVAFLKENPWIVGLAVAFIAANVVIHLVRQRRHQALDTEVLRAASDPARYTVERKR